MTRAPAGKDESPGDSTTPAPSFPRIKGGVAKGKPPESIVWSSGLTPAAVIRTRILPSVTRVLGTSTSFRAPYPVNDSARIAHDLLPPGLGSVVCEWNDVANLLRGRRGCARGKGERAEVEQRRASERKADGFRRGPAMEGGREHGDAQGRADLTARIEHRAADARQRRGHAGQDRGVHRGRDQSCPKAGERQQRPLHEEGRRGRQLGKPDCTGAEDGEPPEDRRARSVAAHQSPCDEARGAEEDADDTDEQTRGRGAMSLDVLELDREHEQAAEEAGSVDQGRCRGGGEGPIAKEVERQHRIGAASLERDERGDPAGSAEEREHDEGRRPAASGPFDQRPGQGGEPERSGRLRTQIEPSRRGRGATLHEAERQQDADDADRNVDEEDAPPPERVDEGAAHQWTARAGHGRETAPDADCPRALDGLGIGAAEDRQRCGHEERRAGPLEDPGGDEPADVGRGDAQRGGGSEDHEPSGEQSPGAEPVAQAPGQKQEAGERQRVPVDDPGKAGRIGVQTRADAGERDVAGGDVQERHAQPEAAGDQGESGVGVRPVHRWLLARKPYGCMRRPQGWLRPRMPTMQSCMAWRTGTRCASSSSWRVRRPWRARRAGCGSITPRLGGGSPPSSGSSARSSSSEPPTGSCSPTLARASAPPPSKWSSPPPPSSSARSAPTAACRAPCASPQPSRLATRWSSLPCASCTCVTRRSVYTCRRGLPAWTSRDARRTWRSASPLPNRATCASA